MSNIVKKKLVHFQLKKPLPPISKQYVIWTIFIMIYLNNCLAEVVTNNEKSLVLIYQVSTFEKSVRLHLLSLLSPSCESIHEIEGPQVHTQDNWLLEWDETVKKKKKKSNMLICIYVGLWTRELLKSEIKSCLV